VAILPTGSAGPTQTIAPQGRSRATGQGFWVPTDPPSATRLAAAEVASSSLEQLLALQETGQGTIEETDPEHHRNRQGRHHAEALLERLRQLQRGLLLDGPNENDLAALARLARDLPSVTDPSLRSLLLAVSQRAEVELAHLEVAQRGAGKNL
jgi:hypothetical protein